MSRKDYKIAVIGLGKLGCPMLAIFADKGYESIGVDFNPKVVESINKFKAPVNEPNLQKLLSANKKRIKASTDLKKNCTRDRHLFFYYCSNSKVGKIITLNDSVISAINAVGEAIKKRKDTIMSL